MKIIIGFICLPLIILSWSLSALADEPPKLTLIELLSFNSDWGKAHDGEPMGVPPEYSWAGKPRMGKGNSRDGYTALTGWGQVFWDKGTIGHPGRLQIRSFTTYLCSGTDRRWELVQGGIIEGAQFRADFKGNASTTGRYSSENGVTTVNFDAGSAFHFWPKQGRARLPNVELCGVVVLLQARTIGTDNVSPAGIGGYLIGLGADYWKDLTSTWDNYKTNTDVGISRLRLVSRDWSWIGLSTASDGDLQRLYGSAAFEGMR